MPPEPPAAPTTAWGLTLDPLPVATPRVAFDVTRLVARRNARAGSGVDRIDLAVGLDLLDRFGPNCRFVLAHLGGLAELPRDLAARMMRGAEARWLVERPLPRALGARLTAAATRSRLVPGAVRRGDARETYVVASHFGLARRHGLLDRLDPEGAMPRLCYLHDLIPLEFPEYQGPGAVAGFERFLAEIAARPVAFAVNSADTGRRVEALAARRGWRTGAPILRIPRVVPRPAPAAPLRARVREIAGGGPFFVALGTIEPRKNHVLLLNIWRELAQRDAPPPKLVLVGRRGWENENVVDMLERCEAIADHVIEFGDLNDAEVQVLLRASRALLMPSFAEGLGIPVMEAASVGAPVVAADLPALREVAAPGTAFLSPLDGLGWRDEILRRA